MDNAVSFSGAACVLGHTAPEAALDEFFRACRRVPAGRALFIAGDRFGAFFAVRGGSFKTGVLDGEGRERVVSFPMAGDPVGLDGLANGVHCTTAIALQDSVVRVIPYGMLRELSRSVPGLARHVHMALSREIEHNHRILLMLGSMDAEERLAAFLYDFALRLGAASGPAAEFQLPMTRTDLGSYLGLRGETVSRLLSRLTRRGVVRSRRRNVQVLDMPLLRALSGSPTAHKI